MKAILRATCDWLLILAFAAAWALFVTYWSCNYARNSLALPTY